MDAVLANTPHRNVHYCQPSKEGLALRNVLQRNVLVRPVRLFDAAGNADVRRYPGVLEQSGFLAADATAKTMCPLVRNDGPHISPAREPPTSCS